MPYSSSYTPTKAAASIWQYSLWSSCWHHWTCAIWRTGDLLPPHGDHTKAWWLFLSNCWPLTAQQALSTGDHYYGVSLWSGTVHQTVLLCPSDPPWPLLSWCLAASSTQKHHKDSSNQETGPIATFNNVLSTFEHKECCADDTTHWLWPGAVLFENSQLAHTVRPVLWYTFKHLWRLWALSTEFCYTTH